MKYPSVNIPKETTQKKEGKIKKREGGKRWEERKRKKKRRGGERRGREEGRGIFVKEQKSVGIGSTGNALVRSSFGSVAGRQL